MVDRFFRLRHDTVIRGDDEHDDVSHFCAARSHHRESLVAWRVEEDDLSSALLDVIRPDVLRNAARLAGGDIRFANRIEQRRFAVVDVTHDGDHGPTRCGALRAALLDRFELDGRFERNDFRIDVEILRDLQRQIGAERLVDGDHEALLHQKMLHEVVRLDVELIGELLDRYAFRERDLASRLFEFEDFRGNRCRLLARVAPCGRSLRLLDFFFGRLRQNDVGSDVFGDDLRSGERPFGEELRVDFDFARLLHAFSGGLLLLRTFLPDFVPGLFATNGRTGRHHRRRNRHRTSCTCRTESWSPCAAHSCSRGARAGRTRARRRTSSHRRAIAH